MQMRGETSSEDGGSEEDESMERTLAPSESEDASVDDAERLTCAMCGDGMEKSESVACAGNTCAGRVYCSSCARDYVECEALLCRALLCPVDAECRRPCHRCGAVVCSGCGTDVHSSGRTARTCFDCVVTKSN